MTNGEKLKEIFPSIELYEKSHDAIQINFGSVWWNAEYKEPINKESSLKKLEPCINYEDGCEEWAGCPCMYYRTESSEG